EQGHLWNRFRDSEVCDESINGRPTDVGRDGQGTRAAQRVILGSNLIQQCPVDAVAVSGTRRMHIDQQKMNSAVESGYSLVREGADGVPARFIPRRKNLDHGHDTVVARVS